MDERQEILETPKATKTPIQFYLTAAAVAVLEEAAGRVAKMRAALQ